VRHAIIGDSALVLPGTIGAHKKWSALLRVNSPHSPAMDSLDGIAILPGRSYDLILRSSLDPQSIVEVQYLGRGVIRAKMMKGLPMEFAFTPMIRDIPVNWHCPHTKNRHDESSLIEVEHYSHPSNSQEIHVTVRINCNLGPNGNYCIILQDSKLLRLYVRSRMPKASVS
jgi:hypothetical protein